MMLGKRAGWIFAGGGVAFVTIAFLLYRFAWSYVEWLLGSEERREILELGLSALALLASILALSLAYFQLIPLQRNIAQIAAEQRRVRLLSKKLIPPGQAIEVRGFDPRFTNRDWNNFLRSYMAKPNIKMRLASSYPQFYDWFQANAGSFSKGVLIVDILYVPHFLKEGLIAPLSGRNGLDLDTMMSMWGEAHGAPLPEETLKMIKLLCSDQSETVGVLPLWINTHGRMIRDPDLYVERPEGRVSMAPTFQQVVEREDAANMLWTAGIQSEFLAFEFWAHLAYRGCRLFTVLRPEQTPAKLRRPTGTMAFTCPLLQSRATLEAFAQAVADLATRLNYSEQTSRRFRSATSRAGFYDDDAFRLGHSGDARMIREGLALWKPVFSSELLWRALPQRDHEPARRLADETCFRPPFFSRDHWSYLSAIGGYGVALPASAARHSDSKKVLMSLFLANPALLHPYVNDMLPRDRHRLDTSQFVERHARPRLPFWPKVETELNELLFEIFLKIDRVPFSTQLREENARDFWNHVVDTVSGPTVSPLLRRFVRKVAAIAKKDDWTYCARPKIRSSDSANRIGKPSAPGLRTIRTA